MKLRKFIVPFYILLGVIIISGVLLLVKGLSDRKTIIYENIDQVEEVNSLKTEEKEKAANATPIIYSNVLIGGKYGESFINAKTFIENNKKEDIQISAFNSNGKMGLFTLKSYRNLKEGITTAITTVSNPKQEYVAVAGDMQIANRYFTKLTSKKDINNAEKTVKKALFKYLMPNSSVNIIKVLGVSIEKETIGELIVATSKDESSDKGVYSAVIYKEQGKSPVIVKLYYAKNEKSVLKNWPVYDVKFVCDLNDDGVYEIILEEVTESKISYSVMEYRKDNKFYQVLKESMNI